jgi:fumarate hydratase class II
MTGAASTSAANKFTAQGTLDRIVRAHAGLKAAAVSLYKIASDLRWLGSGALYRLCPPGELSGQPLGRSDRGRFLPGRSSAQRCAAVVAGYGGTAAGRLALR